MTETPDYLRPFVLSPPDFEPERHGRIDVYAPASDVPLPAVVIVHGGPIPATLSPTPRDWPMYRGYGALLAAAGIVAATVDHRFHPIKSPDGITFGYATAAADITDAIEAVRSDPRVDGDRVVLWFFSGGGLLSGDWLRERPPWLRGIVFSYPGLAPLPGWPSDPRFQPIEAVAEPGPAMPPIILTRVGLERPDIAETVVRFLAAATASDVTVEIIDVPNGHHSFDVLDHSGESRAAVERATIRVRELLT
jgi:dienelactone hydrolase